MYVHYAVYTNIHCTVKCVVHCAVHCSTMYCTVYSVQCTVYTAVCTVLLCSLFGALGSCIKVLECWVSGEGSTEPGGRREEVGNRGRKQGRGGK